MRDEDLRTSCFGQLAILVAHSGDEIPYAGALDGGFAFRGRQVPYLNRQKGIYRAAAQRGPAALSIQTSYRSPYADEPTRDGFSYAYRRDPGGEADNIALRRAYELQVPIVYFVATRPGFYQAIFPAFVTDDDPVARTVLVTPGIFRGPLDEPEPTPVDDPVQRRYVFRETRVRIHQARFRWRVIPAYGEQCAVCRLKEIRLLDAAHIVADVEDEGEPLISNGLSLCTIHHRAYDHDLVGISPDYRVHLARRLLDDDDGPMLDLLKTFDGGTITVPRSTRLRPDRDRLAARFDRFRAGVSPSARTGAGAATTTLPPARAPRC